ncbi:sorbosone dehydrogenase family protein [Ideonella azotifigens]|uniref:Sorbosone dehydrogenase family protein n=1 Tax=Ideonella azotifigens TaxID=513160 RepID=A0ABP3V3I8_9BURK|nr:sorbosone dehydrogenase family protein [Ideonella azotifigens]MCD2340257.1 sorbosone dehydrogenase family protein [Ideonella azotifigens]
MLRSTLLKLSALAASLAGVAACAGIVEAGRSPVPSPADTVGPNPVIKPVDKSLLPTMQIAPAKGWAAGEKPTAAAGLAVNAYATGLDHPRWLYVLPNGDVLVAETDAPPKPDDGKGIRGAVQKKVQAKAGAGVQSPNRITLLRDADGDGVAETRTVFLQGLNSPFGMALVGNELYIADTDAIVRFPYTPGATGISEKGQKLTDLPAGTINHHWTKNIIASADGTKLYATVGSNSNVAENGLAAEEGRAAIWEVDRASGSKRLFATGLRNPNGMAWQGKVLWTVANERDELGNDLVPDYLTSVKQGAFYGWPFSYYGQHVDERAKPQNPALVAKAIPPDYALGAHVAALGLAAADKTALPAPFAGGMFIGEHGSWNRKPPVGYKVVFVPFTDGKPSGQPIDVLTRFVDDQGDAHGRPVGVAIDSKGALLVADDVGNVIWRTSAAR